MTNKKRRTLEAKSYGGMRHSGANAVMSKFLCDFFIDRYTKSVQDE